MTQELAIQGSFFTADDLLPYRETFTVRGSRCDIRIEHIERENWKGDPVWISAGFTISGADNWGYGGPYDVDTDIPALVAKLKAKIQHGPFEKAEDQRIAEYKAWALAHPEEYQAWADKYPEEYHHWLVRSR